MIDTSNLSDEVIPGILEVYQNYGSVLPAGVYTVALSDTTHVKMTPGVNKKGRPFTALGGLTFRVTGDGDGNEEGIPVGSILRFQKSWIETIVNAVFTKPQIASGEGVPISQKAQALFLDELAEKGTTFKVKVDWTAFDVAKYNEILVELAETEDREDPIEAARQMADSEMRAEASKAATLAETYSDFPLNENDGTRFGEIKTKGGNTIRAQANVVRYFLAEGN
jgi:hypothetical protein